MTETTLLVISIIIVASLTATASAVRSVSRIWLRHWVERRLSGAPAAALYLARPQRLILAATTGVALTVFAAGTFIGTSAPGTMLGRAEAIIGYALALLILGQLIPRAVARRWPSVIIPPLLPILRASAADALEGEYTLSGRVMVSKKEVSRNTCDLFIAPRTWKMPEREPKARIALYDPVGKTASALKTLGIPFDQVGDPAADFGELSRAAGKRPLVIGEECWSDAISGDALK